jgi:hypothetical protein
MNPKLRTLTELVRKVVKSAMPEAEELVKWGSLTYVVKGRNVANIVCYSDHVNLGFFMGAKLTSPLLEGTGKGLRHVKVRTAKDVDRKEFARLLRGAVAMMP